ncbi:hypothetical protein EJ04DRAFT_183078 [Polyplosphaeria fusca]|uniref:Uncharacterized protein n=1 Tax=Polyplosphaeria fusca TaxID=682080 RepID=A0A9P4QXS7_9PLEO|nr:hypothetical protein EJ04DRAFT_183078 [Polyplosphaeria fusca]
MSRSRTSNMSPTLPTSPQQGSRRPSPTHAREEQHDAQTSPTSTGSPRPPCRTRTRTPSSQHSPHSAPPSPTPSPTRRSTSTQESNTSSTLSDSSSSLASSVSSTASMTYGSLSAAQLGARPHSVVAMYARGLVCGTYDLGNGRRGAISGPSSGYVDGGYERRGGGNEGDGDGGGGEEEEDEGKGDEEDG